MACQVGAKGRMLKRLAGLGRDTKYRNNIERDLHRAVEKLGIAVPIDRMTLTIVDIKERT